MGVRSRVVAAATAVTLLAVPTAAAAATAAGTDGVAVVGAVWLDLDGDGTRDDVEPGRAGVQVTLRTSATILDAVTTDLDGTWTFWNVPAGDYTVTVAAPIDLEITGGTLPGLDTSTGAGSITVQDEAVDASDVEAGTVGLGSGVDAGADVTATVSLDAAASTAESYVWIVGAYNIGPGSVAGPVDVRLVLTDGHRSDGVSGAGWSCEESDAIVLCSVGGDLAAGAALPTLRVTTVPTGDMGTEVTTTATVRLDGSFDGAPLNDEASATTVISAEVDARDVDGDGTSDLTDAGADGAALALLALLALLVGSTSLRATRRT